ncbi:hypothetical protein Mgra_00001626 [Meloidogyne graminicola]|uniref:Uncharacterized protein n=1 Tax=Meloidogyne graminicola TaxID=189291 RepID=A0A8S9ZZZ0_9BILA|nr:hypothetical protein Mgra_00001626 [Meloidogyne graminicola]
MPIVCRCLFNKKNVVQTKNDSNTSKCKIVQFSPLCGCTLKCLKNKPIINKKSTDENEMENELNFEKEKVEIEER